MTIDRWGSMSASSSPRSQVAPRTPCAPCKARGHHCDAFEIVGGRAVCIHCLDGVDCPRTPRNGVVVEAPKRPVMPRGVVVEAPKRPIFPPVSLQPALAPGAEPSVAMPARRVFLRHAAGGSALVTNPVKSRGKYKGAERARAKEMLASGMSLGATVAATGLSRNTVSSVRKEMPGLPRAGKGGVPRKAADMSAAAAEQVVAEAEAITAQVADEVARRSVQPDGESTDSKQGETKLTTAKDVAVQEVSGLSAKSAAQGYRVVGLDDVPGRKPASVYEDIVADLAALPVNSVVTRSYANEGIAHTFLCGITRIARSWGLKVGQAQDGATIYVWRKA